MCRSLPKKHQSYVVVGLEWEVGIIVREGVHYLTVFDKVEERTG